MPATYPERMTMRTFQTAALAALLILAVALAGCTKQEEEVAKTPQEIMPGLT